MISRVEGGLCLLARDITGHFQDQGGLLDLCERCSITACWSPSGSTISLLSNMWCAFNIPEVIATDGGPQMTSTLLQQSLKAWGVSHRLSSAYLPHSNCRAEIVVKSGKRLLRDNVGPGGTLDNDWFMRAVMQYRNTTSLSFESCCQQQI